MLLLVEMVHSIPEVKREESFYSEKAIIDTFSKLSILLSNYPNTTGFQGDNQKCLSTEKQRLSILQLAV